MHKHDVSHLPERSGGKNFNFEVSEAVHFLHILSNPVRLQMVRMLMDQDLDVTSLAAGVGLAQSPIS